MADESPQTSNRIAQTTVANTEENKRLAPVEEPVYWSPSRVALFIATLSIGVLSAVGSVIASGIFTPATIIGGVLAGITTGLATFFGIKSGGVTK